jgi:DNA modification methylase
MNIIEFGDCRTTMRRWVALGFRAQMCVTSPPYFGLRDYGHPGQLGLEKSPDEYVKSMVEVFRCVRDVLADDGTLWLNLGDSYAGYHGNKNSEIPTSSTNGWTNGYNENKRAGGKPQDIGLKPKDLIGIPWRVAFALQADGWYLRQDIIWHKPNPMPESVTDRCTKAHEYIFMLSKSARYFFNNDAIREPWEGEAAKAVAMGTKEVGQRGINASARRGLTDGQATQFKKQGHSGYFGADGKCLLNPLGANKRSVWRVATRPYKGAHFATFPPALIEPCILATSRPGDIVLDPFMGSGTTAQVALQHGRQYMGCELNPEYEGLQRERISSC